MNYVNDSEKKDHWEKYHLYYLIFGSFVLTTLIILIGNHGLSSRIKKFDKLNQFLEDLEDFKNPFKNQGGEKFIYPNTNNLDPNWLEQIYQKEVKEKIKKQLKYFKNISRYLTTKAIKINLNTVFHGPPGSGKSHYAELLAKNESSAYFIVEAGNLQRKYVGSGAGKFEATFKKAKEIANKLPKNSKPVMIIIDEFDSLAAKGKSDETNRRDDTLVNTLLTTMDQIHKDKLNIVVLATTNYLNMLEEAAIREGRFNHLIEVKYPQTQNEYNELCDYLQKKVEKEMKNKNNREFWAEKNENAVVEFTDDFWKSVKQKLWEIVKEKNKFLEESGFSLLSLQNSLELGCLADKIDDNSQNVLITVSDINGFVNHLKEERDQKIKTLGIS